MSGVSYATPKDPGQPGEPQKRDGVVHTFRMPLMRANSYEEALAQYRVMQASQPQPTDPVNGNCGTSDISIWDNGVLEAGVKMTAQSSDIIFAVDWEFQIYQQGVLNLYYYKDFREGSEGVGDTRWESDVQRVDVSPWGSGNYKAVFNVLEAHMLDGSGCYCGVYGFEEYAIIYLWVLKAVISFLSTNQSKHQ
jgi:hypothetical protein